MILLEPAYFDVTAMSTGFFCVSFFSKNSPGVRIDLKNPSSNVFLDKAGL